MITAIVMAAGFSRRLGHDKLKVELEGKTLFEITLERLLASKVDDIIVVYRDDQIGRLAREYGVRTIENARAEKGQSESIKLGIISSSEDTNGYMFVAADQPYMKVETIDGLVDSFNGDMSKVVVPTCNGKRGNPVIFPYALKDELLSLCGDNGGREVIRENIDIVKALEVEDEELKDIDTKEDLRLLTRGN